MLQVTCQDEDSTQCMPKTAFLALLRHPEVSSSLAAYSRAARVTQDTKSRNDMAHLRALTEEGDDTEICVPGRVYLQLLKDPVVRGDLSAILNGRTQKVPDLLGRLIDDTDQMDAREYPFEYQKRSIATLAKNDDLPISLHDRMAENEDDEEKRAVISRYEHVINLLLIILTFNLNFNETRLNDPFHFIQDLILPFNNLTFNNLKERTNLIFHQFKKFFILLKKYTFFR